MTFSKSSFFLFVQFQKMHEIELFLINKLDEGLYIVKTST